MLLTFNRLVKHLDIPNNGHNRLARLLNWFTLGISLLAAAYASIFTLILGRYDVALFCFLAIMVGLSVNIAVRRNQIRAASIVFVAGIWLVVTLPNFAPTADGVYDAAFVAYFVPILLAGLLLGSSAGITVAVCSVLAGFAFLLRGLSAPITYIETQPTSQILHFSALSLFFLLAAVLVMITNRTVNDALKRAHASEQIAKQFQDRLKELHEVGIQLANVSTLDELHRLTIELGVKHLGFDRMAWFMINTDGKTMQGTYGIDVQGRLSNIRDLKIEFSLENWISNFQRFRSIGNVYFLIDADLKDRGRVVGRGWNAYAAIYSGGDILGWLVADNLLNQQPLQDYQLEILRLYAATLGQLFTQKQTQQLLAQKDKRLRLALNAAQMRSWDWNIVTGEITRSELHDSITLPDDSNYAEFVEQIHPDDRLLVLNAARNMIEHTGIYEAEYRVVDETGAVHWYYSLGQPYHNENGEIIGVSGVLQDITGRKSVEDTLKRADQQAMELMMERERVGALTEFINTISHDFKTPLAIINNSLYLLQRIDDPVKQKDKLSLIKAQTLLLDKQIQDILTISRLEYAPQSVTRPLNINTLLTKVVELFHPSFENKNQIVRLELDPKLPNISANADELDRAFVNLVENAINYTFNGGCITITTRHVGDQIECSVTDTGIGMTNPDTQQIFNNFYRAENARMMNSKGTGLGLAIVKRIVTNHNGTIAVESELGKGTTFRLQFPALVETNN